jgi:hypothetical protein
LPKDFYAAAIEQQGQLWGETESHTGKGISFQNQLIANAHWGALRLDQPNLEFIHAIKVTSQSELHQ